MDFSTRKRSKNAERLIQNASFAEKFMVFPRFLTPSTVQAYDGSAGLNAETCTSADIYALYDALMASHPKYITKTLLGKDASNTKNIYKYVFDFGTAEKTVILGANMHGPGSDGDSKATALGLYEFLRQIYTDWATNESLALLRSSFKFVVIPIENPWGFDNNSRHNYHTVDCNRNFDWHWSEYSSAVKGSSAFSEPESQYVRNVLLEYPNAIAYYALHSMMDTTKTFRWTINTPKPSETYDIGLEVATHLTATTGHANTVSGWDSNPSPYTPTAFLYAENVLGIPSCNPEYVVYPTDVPTPHSSQLMTWMVEFYGNLVYRHCLLKTAYKAEPEPPIVYPKTRGMLLGFNGATISLTDGTAYRLSEFDVVYDTDNIWQPGFKRFEVPSGISYVRISASVAFKCSTAADTPVVFLLQVSKSGSSYPGYAYARSNQVVNSGSNKSPVTLTVTTPLLPVVAGERFVFDVTQFGGGIGIKLETTVKNATWFSVELVSP